MLATHANEIYTLFLIEDLEATLCRWTISRYLPKIEKTLTQIMRIYNQDKRMEFSIEKYAILIMKYWKRETAEGII